MAKGEPEVYRPADACRIAEVAPYVLRYWETEFPALSEGKEKAGAKLYTARDVKIIARIRELLYDEGFTVAGAKKRLDAEIAEGRFEAGLSSAPPVKEQRKAAAAPAQSPGAARTVSGLRSQVSGPASAADKGSRSDLDRRRVIDELKEIVKLLGER